MSSFTHEDITFVCNNKYETEHLLVKGTDIRLLMLQLTSAPLIGRKVALPASVNTLANQVFEAIEGATQQGLNPFVAVTAADRFFESFTSFWRCLFTLGLQKAASELWSLVLGWTLDWEAKHSARIHKGTPLFFLGATLIDQGDADAGFLFVYNAMEEDKAWSRTLSMPNRYKLSPAYKTATIQDKTDNFLYISFVRPIREAIELYVQSFRNLTGASLTLNDIQARFLDNPDLEEVVFFFVYNMHLHVERNRFKQFSRLYENDFGKLKKLDSIFNMCLVIEETLQYRFSKSGATYYISDGIMDLGRNKGWIPAGESKNEFLDKLTNVNISGAPSQNVPVILTHNLTYQGTPLRPELSYLLLAWHLRNYGGHNIEAQDVLRQFYDQIFEWLMYALFLASQ